METKKEKGTSTVTFRNDKGDEISTWDYLNQVDGLVEELKKVGYEQMPTHSFELLKQTRLEKFDKLNQKFIEERKLAKVETTSFELDVHYYTWLKNELTDIERWLSKKPSVSEQIEITKYQNFINTEMEKTKARNATSTIPIITEQVINGFYYEYKDVMPEDAAEPFETFKKRFCVDANFINMPLIPEGKSGRKRDEFSNARDWRYKMLSELKNMDEIKKNIGSFDTFSLNAFGVKFRVKAKKRQK